MIFDTHAHYDSERFDGDRDLLLRSLPEKGIGLILNPGCDGATSAQAVSIAERFSYIYAAVGWHPEEWESWTGESMAILRELVRAEKVVAVGEIGLDYYWDASHKQEQKALLRRQVEFPVAHVVCGVS